MNYHLGAHMSISGGYDKALERVHAIGGTSLQLFSSSPRGWNFAKVSNEQTQLFFAKRKKLGIDPVVFHASYLVNLADDSRIGDNSKKSLIAELNVASKLGIIGSIIHLGSFKSDMGSTNQASSLFTNPKYKVLIDNIKDILAQTPENTFFIIENAGNKKIGQSIDEIASIIQDCDNKRVKVCLDTCHLFSAGYDISTPEKLNTFLTEFDAKIGMDRLVVIHMNDSRDPFDSGRDRHENIGKGTLGVSPFQLLLNDPRTKYLPFIIETPGFDGKGPDKPNLDILKQLIHE